MRSRLLAIPLSLLLLTSASRAVDAEGVTEDKRINRALQPYDCKVDSTPADSPDVAQKGLRRAKIPAGFNADLWASEPMLANPVAFSFDGKGRMFIAETHRYLLPAMDRLLTKRELRDLVEYVASLKE
ncbi:MAG: hypothetical protein ACKV19_15680 [Verrucomicrobiales bacterium]